MRHYTDEDVIAALNVTVDPEVCPRACERCTAIAILDAVADSIANRAAGRVLRIAAADPHARLSGHGGVSVRWLRGMADEIERGAL